jgi:hypothetical protein
MGSFKSFCNRRCMHDLQRQPESFINLYGINSKSGGFWCKGIEERKHLGKYGSMGVWEYGSMGVWEYGSMGVNTVNYKLPTLINLF